MKKYQSIAKMLALMWIIKNIQEYLRPKEMAHAFIKAKKEIYDELCTE